MACMTFKSCDNCYWCRICIHDNRAFKCKINPKKRFNHPGIHGWLCKHFCRFKEVTK